MSVVDVSGFNELAPTRNIMKTTICALIIAIYLLAVQWSADQRRIDGLENAVAGLERIVVKSQLRLSWDKVIIDKWTGLDWKKYNVDY